MNRHLLLLLLLLGACGPGVLSELPAGPASGGGSDAGPLPAHEPRIVQLSVHFRGMQVAQPQGLLLELSGEGFRGSSRVTFNGAARPHILVSDRLLQVVLAPEELGTLTSVRVANPPEEGGSSDPVQHLLSKPKPWVAAVSPQEVSVGQPPAAIRLMGRDFLQGCSVHVGGSPRATTLVSERELTVALTSDDVAAGALLELAVHNPAPWEGGSLPVAFGVRNPVPELLGVTPGTLFLERTGVDGTEAPGDRRRVRLLGRGINRSTQVQWRGGFLHVSPASPEGWEVLLPQESLALAGADTLVLFNPPPGGGQSGAVSLWVEDGPVISRVEPGVVSAGAEELLLEVEGAGFGEEGPASLMWNGAERSAQEAGPRLLKVALSPGDLATEGEVRLRVRRADGLVSAPVRLRIVGEAEAPLLDGLEPGTIPAGSGPTRLRVRGQGFRRSSVVRLDGAAWPTTFVSRTLLEVELGAAQLASGATLQVSVHTPGPGGGSSLAAPLRVEPLRGAPHVTALVPRQAAVGGEALTLRVEGRGFVPASRVLWEGTPLPTTFVDARGLLATVPTQLLSFEGPARVRVETPAPGGGTSFPLTFDVRPASGAVLTECTPCVLTAGSPHTLTLSGSGFTAETRVHWGPAGPGMVPRSWTPTQLTLELWSAREGTAQLLRVSTPPGGLSEPLYVDVLPALVQPQLTALSRSVLSAGEVPEGAALHLGLTGEGLAPSMTLRWSDGGEHPLSGAGPFLAVVDAASLAEPRTVELRVLRPEVPASLPLPLAIHPERAVPMARALRPASVQAGVGGLTLEVRGAGFHAASVVHWNGRALATAWSREALLAHVPATELATPGTFSVTVTTPPPGGGSSLPLRFDVLP